MFPREAMSRVGNTAWNVFYAANGTALTEGWTTWSKPVGAQFVYFIVIGAGSGGGKSTGGAGTVAAGGGASGNIISFMMPAFLLPELLYVRPGQGGLGSTIASQGNSGVTSYIAFYPNNTNYLISVLSGNGGSGNNGATGGATANTISKSFVHGMAITQTVFLYGGQAGSAGATVANATGTGATWGGSGAMTTGGCGGGNGTGAGGSIVPGHAEIPTISGGAGTSGGNGINGFGYRKPIVFNNSRLGTLPVLSFTGGAGGGGHTTGQAGSGGNGAYGCGGGGGGNTSTAGGLSGSGGNGGDGLIIIGAF